MYHTEKSRLQHMPYAEYIFSMFFLSASTNLNPEIFLLEVQIVLQLFVLLATAKFNSCY